MRLCPCGKKAIATCHRCARRICVEHFASTPAMSASPIKLVPCCMPECHAAWWGQFKTSDGKSSNQ